MGSDSKASKGGGFIIRVALPSGLVLIALLLTAFSIHAQEIVDPRSGRLFLTLTDLVVPAGPVILEVQRSLDTRRKEQGLLGTRWRLNWESRLFHYGELVVIEEGSGPIIFTRDGGKPEYTSGTGDRLVIEADGRAVRTRLDGSRDSFDAQGRLVERDLRNGNTISLGNGGDDRLVRIDGPGGAFVRFTADSGGRVVRVETSTGKTLRYGYAGDDLIEVQVDGGPPLRYVYDAGGQLARIERPRTGSVDLTYDAKGRVLSRRWADGAQERYEYDDAANRRRHIDPAGAVTTTVWSQEHRRVEITDPLGRRSLIEFDEVGRVVAVIGPTATTARVAYDRLGRAVSLEDAGGRKTRLDYVGETARVATITRPDGTKQSFEYDGSRNLTAVKVGTETLLTFGRNPDGSLARVSGMVMPERSFSYYPNGRLRTVTNALGEATRFEYDARGNLVREVDVAGGVTVHDYDAQDQLVKRTDAAGRTERFEYDAQGRLVAVTDPGGVTRYEYDPRGRLAAETNPAGQATRYTYDARGRLARRVLSDGRVETFDANPAGNVTAIRDAAGRTTRLEYDPLGRVARERGPSGLERLYRYDAAGNLVHWQDGTGGVATFDYDVAGRLVASAGPSKAAVRYAYDALDRLLSVTDELGHVKRFAYDSTGRLAEVVQPDGSSGRYAYDAEGRVVAARSPGGGEHHFAYDNLGKTAAVTDPVGGQRRNTYDATGRLLSTTDAKGQTIGFAYDAAGRLSEKRLPGGKKVTYQYDGRGNLVRVDDGSFAVVLTYDPAGRLIGRGYPALNRTLRYEYNAAGSRSKLIDSEGRTIGYEYDSAGRVNTIVLAEGQAIAFSYDAKDRLVGIRYPNGVIGRGEYDAESRLTRLTYTDGTGRSVGDWRYQYDAVGNRVETIDGAGHTTRYRYDPAGQLLEEIQGSGASVRYSYLPGGNRGRREADGETIQYTYDRADRLVRAGSDTLVYDANGDLVERKSTAGVTRYDYDAEGRLVKVTLPDGAEVKFGYAPTGERVWHRDKTGLTYFVTDGLNVLAELDERLSPKATYLHGPGVDSPLVMVRDGQPTYYHADRLGSVALLTGAQGQVVAAYEYDAFGKLKNTRGSVPNPFAFTARELDPATGLYYYRARYYDPDLGRFLSPDPLPIRVGEPLDLNRYLYVRNNPVRFIDPLGLDGIEWGPAWGPETPDVIAKKIEVVKQELQNWHADGPPPEPVASRPPANRVWGRNTPLEGSSPGVFERHPGIGYQAGTPGESPEFYQQRGAELRAELNRLHNEGLQSAKPPGGGGGGGSGTLPGKGDVGGSGTLPGKGGGSGSGGGGSGTLPGKGSGGGPGTLPTKGGGTGSGTLPSEGSAASAESAAASAAGGIPSTVGWTAFGIGGAATLISLNACVEGGKSLADCTKELATGMLDPKAIAIAIGVGLGGPFAALGAAGAGLIGAVLQQANVPAAQAEAARQAWQKANRARFEDLYANLAGEIAAQLGPPRQAAFDARGEAREQARAARAAADQARELVGALRGLRDAVQQVAGDCAIIASMLRGQVVAAATEAKNAETSLRAKIAAAEAKAAACATKEDADGIGRLQGEIQELAAKGSAAAARAGDLWVQLQGILERAEVARESLAAAEKNAAEISRLAVIAKASASASQDAAKQAEEKAVELDKKKPVLLARISALQSAFDFPEAAGRFQALIGNVTALASLPGEDTRSVWTGAQDDAARAAGFDGEAEGLLAAMKGLPLCQGITSPDDAVNEAPSTSAFADAGSDLDGRIQVCLAKLTPPPPTLRTLTVSCNPSEAEIGQLVTCTATGAYSDSPSTLVDLSGAPTVWETGPQFTAVAPQPTYTVKATRDGTTATTTVKLKEYNPLTDPLATGGFGAGPVKIPDLTGLGGTSPGPGPGGAGQSGGPQPGTYTGTEPGQQPGAPPGSTGAQPLPGSLPSGYPCGVVPYPPCPPGVEAGGPGVQIPFQGLLPPGGGTTGDGPGGGSAGPMVKPPSGPAPGAGTSQAPPKPPAAPPTTPPTTGGPSCGPATHCTCAGGGSGHIPCDTSKGSCHCGGG